MPLHTAKNAMQAKLLACAAPAPCKMLCCKSMFFSYLVVAGGCAAKFFWFLFFMFSTLLYCTMYGVMAVAITPNLMAAAVLSSAFYSFWNLFAGFILPKPVRPSASWTLSFAALCTFYKCAWQTMQAPCHHHSETPSCGEHAAALGNTAIH